MLLLWCTDVVRRKADMATKSRHTSRTVWQSTNQDEEERRGGAIPMMGDQIERLERGRTAMLCSSGRLVTHLSVVTINIGKRRLDGYLFKTPTRPGFDSL